MCPCLPAETVTHCRSFDHSRRWMVRHGVELKCAVIRIQFEHKCGEFNSKLIWVDQIDDGHMCAANYRGFFLQVTGISVWVRICVTLTHTHSHTRRHHFAFQCYAFSCVYNFFLFFLLFRNLVWLRQWVIFLLDLLEDHFLSSHFAAYISHTVWYGRWYSKRHSGSMKAMKRRCMIHLTPIQREAATAENHQYKNMRRKKRSKFARNKYLLWSRMNRRRWFRNTI